MHNKTIKNTTFYLLQIAISGVLMIILMPIVAHQLAPNEFGQFILAQVYTGIVVGIANLGVIVGYERNFFIYEKQAKKSAQLISSALLFVVTNLSLLTIIVWLYKTEFSQLIFSNNTSANLIFIVFIGGACNSLAQYYLTFFKNSSLAKRYMQFALLQAITNFIIVISLLFLTELKALSLAYAWLISNLLLFGLLIAIYSKKLPLTFNWQMLKNMLKISLPLTPNVFFGFLNTQFDKMMLGFISSIASVGVYNIGQTISLTIFQFTTALDRVFKPEIYRKLFANKHKTNPNEINDYILPFFFASIFVSLLVGMFAKEIIIILFPVSYLASANITIILSVYYASLFFGKITGIQLIYAKKTNISMLLTLLGVTINVGLNIPFIIYWGIIGAAFATTISGIIMVSISYFIAKRYAKITWQWRNIWLLYGVFILGILWTLIDHNNFIDSSYISAISIKLLFIFSYIMLGFKLNIITKQILQDIYRVLTQAIRNFIKIKTN